MANKMKKLLMGNEAFAHAALEAGVRVVAGYPGTPSSELIETIAKQCAAGRAYGVHVEWSTNEKAALELLAGASYCGARTLFTCKQVGLNVASDALLSLNYVGTRGGMVLFVADDPGPISSQTEQDTRRFAAFAKVPVLDPATPEQGFSMMKAAFDLSERYKTPVIVRPTTRICHASTFFEVEEETQVFPLPEGGFERSPRWIIFPKRAWEAHGEINDRLRNIAHDFAADKVLSTFNPVIERESLTAGVIERGSLAAGATVVSAAGAAGDAALEAAGAAAGGAVQETGDAAKGTHRAARLGILAGGVSAAYVREALALLEARAGGQVDARAGGHDYDRVGARTGCHVGESVGDRVLPLAKNSPTDASKNVSRETISTELEKTTVKNPAAKTGLPKAAKTGLPAYKFMQVGTPYPFPEEAVARFVEGLDAILVAEELDYVLEEALLAFAGRTHASFNVFGKLSGHMRERGENDVDDIAACIASFFDSTAFVSENVSRETISGKNAMCEGMCEEPAACVSATASTEPVARVSATASTEPAEHTSVAASTEPAKRAFDAASTEPVALDLPVRPPVLCSGCPHRGSFYAVKRALKNIGKENLAAGKSESAAANLAMTSAESSESSAENRAAGRMEKANKVGEQAAIFCGDIGCYTLGNAKPLDAIDTCLCMGAGITMAQGFAVAEPYKKHIAFVGDSTFFASAMTGVANAVYNNHNITVAVLDNSTTAMTGGQPHPGTGVTLMGGAEKRISIEAVLQALGVECIVHANPLNLQESISAAQKAISFEGPSAILFESPCVQLIRPSVPAQVNAQTCTGCKKCIAEIGCPAIGFKHPAKIACLEKAALGDGALKNAGKDAENLESSAQMRAASELSARVAANSVISGAKNVSRETFSDKAAASTGNKEAAASAYGEGIAISTYGKEPATSTRNKEGGRKDRGVAFVDDSLCNGCGLCTQICPFSALEIPVSASAPTKILASNEVLSPAKTAASTEVSATTKTSASSEIPSPTRDSESTEIPTPTTNNNNPPDHRSGGAQ